MSRRPLLGIGDAGAPPIVARYFLGDAEYKITLRWSERETGWFADVEEVGGDVLLVGFRCATGRDLLVNVPGAGAIGQLLVEDPSGAHREADTLSSWASGLRLLYDNGEA